MERSSSLEALLNRAEQRQDDREHNIRKPQLLPFKFNWLNEN